MIGIAATRRTAKQLVDGTWAVTLHIDPPYAAEFLRLFPSVDMPCALAPLVKGFDKLKPESEPQPKAKGGAGSQWLAMRCAEPAFWEFLAPMNGVMAPKSEAEAAAVVREHLRIASRAEVDTDPDAKVRFDELRLQWIDWCAEND